MTIRAQLADDDEAISSLINAAFAKAEHSGGNEARIVAALRDAGSLTISLVATEDQKIVGYAAFSPVTVDERSVGWFGLGPVAVLPERQRHGVGSALIRAGLAKLREHGARGCVVLGDPRYYARFGFAADPNLQLSGVPAEYFQRISFDGHSCTGTVRYDPAFLLG